MSKLQGKVAVVTGASKGIGAEIARDLAAAGAKVVVNYASSREGADKVVADITAKGGKAIGVQGDVAKVADVERLFAETKKAYGHVDILVNNAGVFKFAPIDEFSADEFHRQSIPTSSDSFRPPRKPSSTSILLAARSSTSAPPSSVPHLRVASSTRPPRVRSTPLRTSSPKSSHHGRSASTASTQAAS